jgi:cobaltochelatase CobT
MKSTKAETIQLTPREIRERAIAAATRALSCRRELEITFREGLPQASVTEEKINLPGLGVGVKSKSVLVARGEADAAALTLRYHQPKGHARQRPVGEKSAAIYDALEKARVEMLGGQQFQGVRANLAARLDRYCEMQGYDRMSERADPPLADLIALLARESIGGEKVPARMQNLLNLWRPMIMTHAETLFDAMGEVLENQQAYGQLARKLIDALHKGKILGGAEEANPAEDNNSDPSDENRENLEAEPDQSQESQPMQAAPGTESLSEGGEKQEKPGELNAEADLEAGKQAEEERKSKVRQAQPNWIPFEARNDKSGYHAYTTEYDEIIEASELADDAELHHLREQLDKKLNQYHGVTSRLASRLQRLLLAQQARQWMFEQEDGLIDSARLARVVTAPDYPYYYKFEQDTPFRDTIVTLLLDNSGSMRGRPITIAALSADILARTLERCGVKVEILGFTTRDWKGGLSRKQWMRDNRPANPGRLNDLRHIIYKSADTRWHKARKYLGLMLKEGILKENIDGEAVLWAHERLLKRTEKRRILMVISDGAPVDDSTLSINHGSYLDHHLREVIQWIETVSPVELLAIGIGHDVTRYYRNAVKIVDVDQLGDTMVNELTRLFREDGNGGRRGTVRPPSAPATLAGVKGNPAYQI